ncbi:MAG: hypothetical protein FJW36_16030 [Acidobacteria bacterium]|nr:hypothetical protein [Acidobacteriota bacterium]
MKVKKPAKVRWCHPPKGFSAAHRVRTGDSFVSMAAKYGFADPWDIIQYNYGTKDPEEVNWYLQELVGCTKSKDGINYSFDSSDRFGIVFIPPKGWKPGQAVETHAYDDFKEYLPSAKSMVDAPYINEATVRRIMMKHIFLVGDMNLRVMAEYDYGNIIYVRTPQNPAQLGRVYKQYIYKEMMHLAYGKHGMNMAYSVRTEAVALIAAMMDSNMLKSVSPKLPPNDEFFLNNLTRTRMIAEVEAFLAAYKRNRGTASIDGVVRLLSMESQLTKRLMGFWPVAQAA